MIRVLYVSPNGYLGGAERFVLSAVAGHRSSRGVESGILFFSSGEACQEAQRLGLKTFVLKNVFRFRSPIKLFRALVEIRKHVVHYRPDILHLTMPYSHIALSLATVGLGIKKVWFQHGPIDGKLDQIANLFPVDMIWYNSAYLQERHHRIWPRTQKKTEKFIIKLGVKRNNFLHMLFLHPVIKMGSSGRICYWKGFHTIITALGELKKEAILKPYSFKLAGAAKNSSDQEYANELVKLVQQFDLTKEVEFLNHLQDMDDFYQDLDVFIHSSVIPEPFGLVVAEAMINGCLVLGSDTGGVRDLLQDGKTGISFPSTSEDSINALKKILKEILGKENDNRIEDLRSLAKNGRDYVGINYSIEKMIIQMEELYLRLMEK